MTSEEYTKTREEVKNTIAWEPIDNETARLMVPGGWLYRSPLTPQ